MKQNLTRPRSWILRLLVLVFALAGVWWAKQSLETGALEGAGQLFEKEVKGSVNQTSQ